MAVIRVGLNAGFGSRIGAQAFTEIQRREFTVIRQDIDTDNYFEIASLVAEFVGHPIMPLFVMGTGVAPSAIVTRAGNTAHAAAQAGIAHAIEVYNEPDINGVSPETFAATIRNVVEVCPPGTQIVTGGISSTSKPALAWLRAAMPGIPSSCIIGTHTYRKGPPDKPLDGFASRQAEFDELRSIVGERRVWNTEVGWNDFKKRGGWCSKPLSPSEVASNLRREIVLCREAGIEVLIVYQLNDGRGPEEHFGIRTVGGAWKPSAEVAQRNLEV